MPATASGARELPTSLACRSDGSLREMAISTLKLPDGFTRVTGKVRRPRLRDGQWLLRIVLANGAVPPTHAAGLKSLAMPAPSNPGPIRGYPLSLFASADNGQFSREGSGSLIVADEFALTYSIERPGQLEVRLDWEMSGAPRSQSLSVPIAREDLSHLTIACWNGDFELYDLQAAAR